MNGSFNYHYPYPRSIFTLFSQIGFCLTHRIRIVNNPIPEDATWNNNDFLYVSRPSYNHHIGHFAEAINPLIFALRFPSIYPLMTDYLITNYDPDDEYDWDKTFLDLMISLFPNNMQPKLHFTKKINITHLTCFRHAVTITLVS